MRVANCIRFVLVVLSSCFWVTGLSANVSMESFKSVMDLPDDSLKLQKLYELSRQQVDVPIELTYLDALLKEAALQQHVNYQALAYRNKVRYFYNQLVYDSLYYYKELAKPFLLKNKQYDVWADLETMEINLHAYLGEYEFALFKANEMYSEAVRNQHEEGVIAACESIGFSYYSSGRYDEAISWYRKALSLLEKQENRSTYQIQLMLTMSNAQFDSGEIDDARVSLDSLKNLLQEYESASDSAVVVRDRISEYWLWVHMRYADLAIRDHQLDKAQFHLNKAVYYARVGVNETFFDLLYYVYVDYYLAVGDYTKAQAYEKKAAEVALRQTGSVTPEMIHVQARICQQMKDFKAASILFNRELALSDSINQQRFLKQATQLSSIYEVDTLTQEGEREQLKVDRLVLMKASLSLLALVLGVFILLFYIYKRKLSAATRYAEESDSRTSIFLDNMSREIRVSLTEIAVLSSKLIGETKVEERWKYAEEIKAMNNMLQHVIFNVLDVSKIESGKMKFNYADVYLPGVMRELESLATRYISPSVSLRVVPGKEVTFESDVTRLMQVLDNLMNYLVSHTTEGVLSIDYTIGDGRVNFVLSDTGLVLSGEDQQMLFDRQVQATHRLQDMGLDLIVCKELILKMGGEISVFSDKEKGTVFKFSLPLKSNV